MRVIANMVVFTQGVCDMSRNIIFLFTCIIMVIFCRHISWSNPSIEVQQAGGFFSYSSLNNLNTCSDLDGYLSLVRKVDPYAFVTGWFWDWRGISIYRKSAGFHLGYDIAMPAGTLVPVGWAGTVRDITLWADGEWGITVVTTNNYSITYGHLSPRVSLGNWVNVGDIVGVVVIDHVDIKIRNSTGNFVDFGKTFGLLPVDGTAVVHSFKDYLTPSVDPRLIIKSKIQEISRLKKTIFALEDYLQIEMESYRESKVRVESMEKLLQEELICRKTLEDERKAFEENKKRAQMLEKRLQAQKQRLEMLNKEVSLYGVRQRSFIKDAQSKSRVSKGEDKISYQKEIEETRQKLILYKKLFEEGAISKKELEGMEKNYKKVQLEAVFEEEE